MKKLIVSVMIILSVALVFAGCGERGTNDMKDKIDSTADSAMDKLESGVNSDVEKISRDRAKEIAFQHAAVNESDAYDIEVEYDTDDGVHSYEVTFETKSAEYDYHIHTDTGEIISSSKEDKNQNTAN